MLFSFNYIVKQNLIKNNIVNLPLINYLNFVCINSVNIVVSFKNVSNLGIVYFYLYFSNLFTTRPIIYKLPNGNINFVFMFKDLYTIFNCIDYISDIIYFFNIAFKFDLDCKNFFTFLFKDISKLPMLSLDFLSTELSINFFFFYKINNINFIYYLKNLFKSLFVKDGYFIEENIFFFSNFILFDNSFLLFKEQDDILL